MGALGYYLIIDKIKEKEVKVGGLFIPESQNKDIRYGRATVVSSGSEIKNICSGDIIRYDKFAGHDIELDDSIYTVIKLSDVIYIEDNED